MNKQLIGGLAAVAALAFTAGCSDDDSEGDLALFCRLSAEADSAEEFPSDDELDDIVDAAPEEIRDDAETLADAIRDLDPNDPAGFEVFNEPDVAEASANIEAFEAENCDQASGDGDDSGDDSGDDESDDTTTTTEPEDTTTTSEEETTTTTSG